MIEADTPTLWELRQEIGHPSTVAILVKAFIHAAKLVNLDRNLTTEQIGEAANDILENKGYLKVEEIKFLLKRALRTQNLYGRLDYNIIMNWVEEYDTERTDEAMSISDGRDTQSCNQLQPRPDAISFTDYMESLKKRAQTDKTAAALLADIENPPPARLTLLSNEARRQKEHEYQLYRFNYLFGKKQ